jgi:hypothetical protein
MKKQSRLAAIHRRQVPRGLIDKAENTGTPCWFTWIMARTFNIITQVIKRVDG